MPLAGHGALAPIEVRQQQWREVNDPEMEMVNAYAALGHYILQVGQAQAIGQIPGRNGGP